MLQHYLLTGIIGKQAAAASTYTLTVTSGSITLTGGTVALRVARTLAANTGSITLTGSSVALRVGRSIAVSPASLTLTGSSVTLTYAPVTGSNVVEVTWPAELERSRAIQRANLARYLMEERERIAKEAKKPTRAKVKKAVARVIERAAADGILTTAQFTDARPIIREMLVGDRLGDIQAEIDALMASLIRAREAWDDEAAAILLLAA